MSLEARFALIDSAPSADVGDSWKGHSILWQWSAREGVERRQEQSEVVDVVYLWKCKCSSTTLRLHFADKIGRFAWLTDPCYEGSCNCWTCIPNQKENTLLLRSWESLYLWYSMGIDLKYTATKHRIQRKHCVIRHKYFIVDMHHERESL